MSWIPDKLAEHLEYHALLLRLQCLRREPMSRIDIAKLATLALYQGFTVADYDAMEIPKREVNDRPRKP